MEKEQMAEILKKKIQCVECSVDGNCDGACERCILGDDSSEVLEALNHALNLVNREGLKIKDLIEDRKGAFGLSERLLEGRLVALDSKTGHQIFDTRVNTKKTVQKYYEGTVLHIWSSNKEESFGGFSGTRFCPVTMVYVEHDSWKEGDQHDLG